MSRDDDRIGVVRRKVKRAVRTAVEGLGPYREAMRRVGFMKSYMQLGLGIFVKNRSERNDGSDGVVARSAATTHTGA
jgi:hypothetical protein